MKVILRTLLAFGAFYLLYDYLFARYLPNSHVWHKIIMPAGLMLLPFSILFGIFRNVRMHRLIRKTQTTVPQDGKWVALTGTISPMDECLKSPFTKADCVAYSYCISSDEFSSALSKATRRGEMSLQRRYYGYSRVPWVLRSSVVNVQMMHFFGTTKSLFEYPPPDDRVANAREFVQATSFEKRSILGTELLEFPPKIARKDWISTHSNACPDLKECHVEEQYLPIGLECLMTRIWSNETQSLTTDVTLFPGTRSDILRGIKREIITQSIMVPFLILFINFFFYNVF